MPPHRRSRGSRQPSGEVQEQPAASTPPTKDAPAPAGRAVASGRGSAGLGELLASLPLPLLELICQPLDLRERVAFASCWSGLLARPDVTNSVALWGALSIARQDAQAAPPSSYASSLAAWLARRRGTVRELRLSGRVGDPTAALRVLEGGHLAVLSLRFCPASGQASAAAPLQALSGLTALTHLEASACRLQRVPHALEALGPRLKWLNLAGNEALAGSEGSLQPLQHLVGLSHLDLSGCKLKRLPQQLSALTRLADLCVAGNPSLGHWSKGNFHYAQHLVALTSLDASRCGLACIPPQLAALPRLASLEAAGNEFLGSVGDAFDSLPQLTALLRLGLSACGLSRVPQLQSQLGLRELDLSGNADLGAGPAAAGAGAAGAWVALAQACGLRCLHAKACGLQRLPEELKVLAPSLQDLRLDDNHLLGAGAGAGGEGALAALGRLSCLSRLSLGCCGLGNIPTELAALQGLRELNLAYNVSLIDFRAVQQLASLQRLSVRGCSIHARGVADQLHSLGGVGLDVDWNGE